MSRIYVGRQPIFDRDLAVLGYELLFRDRDTGSADFVNGTAATSQVIVNTFVELGLHSLVGSKLAFVNLTRPFLVGDLPLPVPQTRAVLEVLEHVRIDGEVLSGIRRLADEGYQMAVDDFVWTEGSEDLLGLASFVKLDVLEVPPAQLAEMVARCREYDAMLVAEKVETREQQDMCRELGFDYFQGFFLSRPSVVGTHTLVPNRITAMDLVAKLSRSDVTIEDIDAILRIDVALSYRVLRAANAAALGLRRRISSVREAVVLLGLRQLRSWVLLMVLADAGTASEEQLSTAMARARMCELLAPRFPEIHPDAAFTAGLLSAMDFLLDAPLPVIVEQMPLEGTLEQALLLREGSLGRLLDSVIAYEHDDLDRLSALPLDVGELSRAYLEAVAWSLQTCESVLEPSL